MCVCVDVCVREKERERECVWVVEREKESDVTFIFLGGRPSLLFYCTNFLEDSVKHSEQIFADYEMWENQFNFFPSEKNVL